MNFFCTLFLFITLFLMGCRINNQIHGNDSLDPSSIVSESQIKIETAEDGTGSTLESINIDIGNSSQIYSIHRDILGKFVKNLAVTWQLSGGVGTLTISSDGKSALFNGVNEGSGEIVITVDGVSKSIAVYVNNPLFVAALDQPYLYAKNTLDLSHTLKISGGVPPYSNFILTTNPNGASVSDNSGLPQVTLINPVEGLYSYTLQITDSLGKTASVDFSIKSNSYYHCVWNGSVDKNFANPSNWDFCHYDSSANWPQSTDRFTIDSGPINQPTLSSNASVLGIGPYLPSGGTLSIGAGATLSILDENESIGSDLKIQGDSPSCTTCAFGGAGADKNIRVINSSTLNLGTGIQIKTDYAAYLRFGNGITPGHLVVNHGDTNPSHWPRLIDTGYATGLVFQGEIGGAPSEMTIDGLSLKPYWFGQALNLVNNFRVKQFDNVHFENIQNFTNRSSIVFGDCTNSFFDDKNWTGIVFNQSTTFFNIDANSCVHADVVTVSGSGVSYGSIYDRNGQGLLTWGNDSSLTCTWNGSQGTDWKEPLNWDNCVNGRNNYPDGPDSVIIPGVATLPIITGKEGVNSFASASGGGTVTVNSAANLWIGSGVGSFKSNITFQGEAGCTDCTLVSFRGLEISNDATLTLGTNIQLHISDQDRLYVGSSTSAGHFKSLGGAIEPDWPVIRPVGVSSPSFNGITIEGVSSLNRSTIAIDGLNMQTVRSNASTFSFLGAYQVLQFDDVILDNSGVSGPSVPSINIVDCTDSIFSDLVWDNFTFTDADTNGGVAVSMTNANCSGMSAVGFTNHSGGSLNATENDPFFLFDWL